MVYIKRSDGVYVSFVGVSEAAVVAMLAEQGLTCDVVDEATFTAANSLGR